MVEIVGVKPGSIADHYGLTKGDKIVAINGAKIKDYIDYQYETAEAFFILEIIKKTGEKENIEITREPGQELGIELNGIIYDRLKTCTNNCIFCFVNQQPEDLRKTLLLKDDDYRFSFLQGSFITLTNLTDEEIKRIINLRLSPLNISVHTTNPSLRVKMMRNPEAGRIMEQLKRLVDGGIEFNVQLVLCPGTNDGKELERSLKDLFRLYPSLKSIGLVPVGLTRYRKGLYPLKSYDKEKAEKVLDQVEVWQEKAIKRFGKNFIYAADEFYLMTGRELPAYEDYHDFPQLENGIGLTRLLWKSYANVKESLPPSVAPRWLTIITGELGEMVLRPIQQQLDKIENLKVTLLPVKNDFFGQEVTVTGLLTGSDIIKALDENNRVGNEIILPGIALNDHHKFLDDFTITELEEKFPAKTFYICHTIEEVVEVIKNG